MSPVSATRIVGSVRAAVIAPLFSPDGGAFSSAPMAGGPWDERMMHGGAPSALLARAVESVEPAGDLAVTRLTIGFL